MNQPIITQMNLTSTGFSNREAIPVKYTCDGMGVSPPLEWSSVPDGTVSFVLIFDDPDAPAVTWVHWVLYNIPRSTTRLPEGVEALEQLPDGSLQGLNDFNGIGYGGPCPPPGDPHRYYFRLYALDAALPLAGGETKRRLLRAMDRHILTKTSLMGIYGR